MIKKEELISIKVKPVDAWEYRDVCYAPKLEIVGDAIEVPGFNDEFEIYIKKKKDDDERIRNEILECIETLAKQPGASPRLCDWIAWLEKQKEQNLELYYDKELDSAAREFYFSGGADSPVDSTGLVPIVRMAEFGATWMKKKMEKEQTEELSTRLNGLMQEYVKSGKDEEEQEHRLKCYHLFWDALGDSEFFKQKEQKPENGTVFKGFVAVDYCGDKMTWNPTGRRVSFFTKKPVRDLLTENHYWASIGPDYESIKLGYECFPELKWEDEPVEVELVIYKTEQKPVDIAPNQFDGITYGMQGYSTEKPVEWSEEYREEDLQTRFAFYTYKDDPSVLYLSNVFVEESSRNHGFGTRILKAAEKAAEAIGATTISLKVKQDSPANAWYRKNGYGYVTFEDGYDWLEKNLEYMKPVKPVEWDKKDEDKLYLIIENLLADKEVARIENPQHYDVLCKAYDELIDFLKSLPERFNLQPKQEWSVEDKKMLQSIIDDFRKGHVSTIGQDRWLKSLRSRQNLIMANSPHLKEWKPSEEQMSGLLVAIGDAKERGSDVAKTLQSLYRDLKKRCRTNRVRY